MTFALFVSFKSWKNNFRKRLANTECTQPHQFCACVQVWRAQHLGKSCLEEFNHQLFSSISLQPVTPCPCSQQAGWQHIQSSQETRPGSFLAKQTCNSLCTLLKSLSPEIWNPGLFKAGSKPPNNFTEVRIIKYTLSLKDAPISRNVNSVINFFWIKLKKQWN